MSETELYSIELINKTEARVEKGNSFGKLTLPKMINFAVTVYSKDTANS